MVIITFVALKLIEISALVFLPYFLGWSFFELIYRLIEHEEPKFERMWKRWLAGSFGLIILAAVVLWVSIICKFVMINWHWAQSIAEYISS